MIQIEAKANDCLFQVHVTPKSKRPSIGGLHDGALRVSVAEPADKGKANKAVTQAIASLLKVAKSRVEVLRGETSRRKTIRVRDVTIEELKPIADLAL
ncbi:hypothetical protein CA13_68650 [Planctomycetes bacterium CA13]|uniref:UPF0235 protein CA13_68650 n=1 Tax=Novipirellula herctigrandis TaxID=2527986 RepID=A0A5C5YN64_9BACT|nr:hypothetical protein CA13_68650 [Planctomycetes bacterium CA13]